MLCEPDSLRLNVLLTQSVQAVRVDESRMQVVALTERGEATVQLHPAGRPESYLRSVRDWLSMHVLGSPGGYPPYIHRWTRMGQGRSDRSLEQLLLLGDREAVVAVAHAPDLTEELARRVWWIAPDSDFARSMLDCPAVSAGALGAEMVGHLLEHLPFEEEPGRQVESLARILAHPSLDDDTRTELWRRAHRQSAYAVGFLASGIEPPVGRPAHPGHDRLCAAQGDDESPLAQRMRWAWDVPGQNFLAALMRALRRLPDQETAVALCNALGQAFSLPGSSTNFREIARLEEDARAVAVAHDWEGQDEWAEPRLCVLRLARVGEHLLDPVLGVTDAVGSVMRRRLEPALGPVRAWAQELFADD